MISLFEDQILDWCVADSKGRRYILKMSFEIHVISTSVRLKDWILKGRQRFSVYSANIMLFIVNRKYILFPTFILSQTLVWLPNKLGYMK